MERCDSPPAQPFAKRCRIFGKHPATACVTEVDATRPFSRSVLTAPSTDTRNARGLREHIPAPVRLRRQRFWHKSQPWVPRGVGEFPVDVWARVEQSVSVLLRLTLKDPRHLTATEPSDHCCHWPRLSLPDFCALVACNHATADMGRRRAPEVYGHVILCAELFTGGPGSIEQQRCIHLGGARGHLRREASARGAARMLDLAQARERGACGASAHGAGTGARFVTFCKRARRFLCMAPVVQRHMRSLDLTQAGHNPEESVAVACMFAQAISTLPRLRLVCYPSTGWGSVAQHRKFHRAFESRSDVTVKAKSCGGLCSASRG